MKQTKYAPFYIYKVNSQILHRCDNYANDPRACTRKHLGGLDLPGLLRIARMDHHLDIQARPRGLDPSRNALATKFALDGLVSGRAKGK